MDGVKPKTETPPVAKLPVPDRTVHVPTRDPKDGSLLPAWRVARWHLFNAANLLMQEHDQTRGEDGAEDLSLASDVARQLYHSLDDRAPPASRAFIKRMAHGVERKTPITRADAEQFLLERLPATVSEARRHFPDGPSGEGIRNLASSVLHTLAAQRHADALKVLHRWGVRYLGQLRPGSSPRFEEDCDELRAAVFELFETHGNDTGVAFREELVRRAYRIVGLRRPLDARKRNVSRKRAKAPSRKPAGKAGR